MPVNKQSQSWDPSTRVLFPTTTYAHVKHEHDGVCFATATRDADVFGNGGATAWFVQDNVYGEWHRISELDFETVTARCKATPRARLLACPSETQVIFTFAPAEWDSDRLVRKDDRHDTTSITVKRLEQRGEAA